MQEAFDSLRSFFRFSIGLGVIWAACFVDKLVLFRKLVEFLAGKLWSVIRYEYVGNAMPCKLRPAQLKYFLASSLIQSVNFNEVGVIIH